MVLRSRLYFGWFALLVAAVTCQAVAPEPVDQEQMQDAMRRLMTAINDRNFDGMKAVTTPDFDLIAPVYGSQSHTRFKALIENRGGEFRNYELATLVRSLRVLTSDVCLGDGFFRTVNHPRADLAGRVTVTFVRSGGKWLVAAARFIPLPFERPILAVQPAANHAPPGSDGWITLFDGRSNEAFIDVTGEPFPGSWTVEEGTLKAVTGKGRRGLRTADTYRSFELRFDWKVPAKGNAGIKYRLFYLTQSQTGSDGAGHEYQIADDAGDPGAIRHATERAGSLYNQIAPAKAVTRPVGEFNESILIVRGRHCEHWLNGEKVVEYESESGPLEGPILFQHHGTEVWYKNIRIRRLDSRTSE